MHAYFAEFRIVGEVADFLYLQDPGPRLLVDMSIAPAQSTNPMLPRYPHKLATEITNDLMAATFLREVAVGDVIELTGTFSQDGYRVHDKEFVDTAMTVTAYRALQRPSEAPESTFGQLSSFSTTLVH